MFFASKTCLISSFIARNAAVSASILWASTWTFEGSRYAGCTGGRAGFLGGGALSSGGIGGGTLFFFLGGGTLFLVLGSAGAAFLAAGADNTAEPAMFSRSSDTSIAGRFSPAAGGRSGDGDGSCLTRGTSYLTAFNGTPGVKLNRPRLGRIPKRSICLRPAQLSLPTLNTSGKGKVWRFHLTLVSSKSSAYSCMRVIIVFHRLRILLTGSSPPPGSAFSSSVNLSRSKLTSLYRRVNILRDIFVFR